MPLPLLGGREIYSSCYNIFGFTEEGKSWHLKIIDFD